MANQDIETKLITLAIRAKGSITNFSEVSAIKARVATTRPSSRADVRKIIALALNESENTVLVKLAAHDDSDRLIDEIITGFKK
jgi:hypothetical protein